METATEDTQKESADTANVSNTANNATIPAPAEPKRNRKDDRNKRDDKNLEQFMKTLNPIPTVDEKLSLVCKKYVQATDEIKKMTFYIKQSDKRHALVVKEKEQLQLEFNKTVLVKSKLENLCRELQKQNKAIKEESLLKIREEEERRKETQAKFQNTLSEITAMLQQNNEKNAKLRDDNISMTEKFKSVVTQYQLREQQVDKMSKQMALENQLSEAKMQKQNLEHQADKERLLSEMEQLKVTVATYRAKMKEFKGVETSLRSQLEVYTDKYEEFQNALVKSNQMFGGFQEQMDKMSKKIKKLEKESLSYKTRWETSQAALLDMCGERQVSEEKAAASNRQLQHMQSLCRTLQAERGALLATLKEHNIERPPLAPPAPLPAPAPAPAPSSASAPASNAKVDAMAANCAQLRQSLAHLQTQLNVLTNKQNEETPKPEPKPEKQEKKKSKSKKNKGEKKAENNAPKEESDLTDENQTSTSENLSQNTEKGDDTTLETLIQAINNANINLCDLEVVSDEFAETVKTNFEIKEITEEDSSEVKTSINEVSPTIEKGILNKEVSFKIDEVVPNEEENPKGDTVILNEKVSSNVDKVVSNEEIGKVDKEVLNKEASPKVKEVLSEKVSSKVDEVVENAEVSPEIDLNEVKNALTNLNLNSPPVISPTEAKVIQNGDSNLSDHVEETQKGVNLEANDAQQNVSIVESANDEVSHINEVKPILNNA